MCMVHYRIEYVTMIYCSEPILYSVFYKIIRYMNTGFVSPIASYPLHLQELTSLVHPHTILMFSSISLSLSGSRTIIVAYNNV